MEDILNQPVLPGVPADYIEEDQEVNPIGELYDHVIPDTTGGLSVEAINIAYSRVWDVEFELWVVNSDIATITNKLVGMKADLSFREAKCILEKINPGTNDPSRAAWSKEYFAEDYTKIKVLEDEITFKKIGLAEANMVHTITKSNITRLEMILKLAETSTMISMMNPPQVEPPKMPAAPVPSILIPTPGNMKH